MARRLRDEISIRLKTKQLKAIMNGSLSPEKLVAHISRKRREWVAANIDMLTKKYADISLEEAARRMIYLDHMEIDPSQSVVKRAACNKIRIRSYNFCPYLEACTTLGLDTRAVCRDVSEPPMHAMVKAIDVRLKFSRNYERIRPYCEFCEEYIECEV